MAGETSAVEKRSESPDERVSEMSYKEWPFRSTQKASTGQETVSFPVDIFETEEAFVIVGEMPGVAKKDVQVEISENELTITGCFHVDLDSEERPSFYEIPGADYRRTFTLSEAVDREKITAGLKEGLLTLCLGKSESVKPRRIEISA